MRLGLFGGSFDPVHSGHIVPVRRARERLELDRVVYLPTACPPHKPDAQVAAAHHRYAMVEMALLHEEGLFASPFELTPNRPAYTIDTLEYFERLHRDAELHLLLGADSFAELDSWHRWQEIARLARLAVLMRPGWMFADLRARLAPPLVALAETSRVVFIENEEVAVSSTRLRASLARGESVSEESMPPLVLEYIRKYSLYS